jgi:pyroglutamyl-peptidase
MRLLYGRAADRARRIVGSFRPTPTTSDVPRVVLSGFGPFPGVSRNATADMIRALGASAGIDLAPRSYRARDFVVGAGMARLPSGRTAHVSLMVLPVVWDVAAALVAKQARALRASLVIMSGIAAPVQPIFIELGATCAHTRAPDAFGLRPRPVATRASDLSMTLDAHRAESAARDAIAHEASVAPRFGEVVRGVVCRTAGSENAYVCNATAYGVAAMSRRRVRVLRTGACPSGVELARTFRPAQGFLHWPSDTDATDATACARVLSAIVDTLIAP